NPNPIREGVLTAMEEALRDATCSVLCMFDGMDSTGPCDNLPRIIEECNKVNPNWRFIISSLPNFLKDLKSKVDYSRLKVLKGERRRPSHDKAFNAFLKDSISSRMYLKIRNAEVERALLQWCEPFCVLAEKQGMEYPQTALRLAWKQLLANHSHDAICGLSPDQIHKDMMARFDQAFIIAEACTKKALGTIITGINTANATPDDVFITVFNPLPYERTDVVRCFVDIPMNNPNEDYRPFSITGPNGTPVAHQTMGREQSYLIATERSWLPSVFPTWKWQVAFEAKNIPPLGFATYRVRPEPWPRKHNYGTLTCGTNIMENEFLLVRIENNGTLTVTDKRTGEIYSNLNFFEDAGECGDPWWRWVPPSDRVLNTLGLQAEIVKEIDGPVMTTFSIRWHWLLPVGVTEKKTARSTEERELTITSFVTLKKGVPRVEIKTVVNNTVRDHRLRMMAEAGFKPSLSFAHTQFDVVERPVHLEDTSNWLEQWTGTHPMNGCHGTYNEQRGIAVLSFGLTEYEVCEDEVGTIATTLLRTFQYPKMSGLFREDRVKRLNNEGSQMLGEHTFHYAFYFFRGNWEQTDLLRQMNEFKYPVTPAQHGQNQGKLFGLTHSFLQLSPSSLCLTTLKKAEKGNNIIVRFYNPLNESVEGKLWSFYRIKKAYLCNLDESVKQVLEVASDGHELLLSVPKKKIITLKLSL
ncbi:MAG: glycosyl hydrolase-related protein, partial [Candidatus Sumerlaeia bacterium]|nr:glycosyl hydrolase-related protein [Candidatus Sumerlaeia bacterium]